MISHNGLSNMGGGGAQGAIGKCLDPRLHDIRRTSVEPPGSSHACEVFSRNQMFWRTHQFIPIALYGRLSEYYKKYIGLRFRL